MEDTLAFCTSRVRALTGGVVIDREASSQFRPGTNELRATGLTGRGSPPHVLCCFIQQRLLRVPVVTAVGGADITSYLRSNTGVLWIQQYAVCQTVWVLHTLNGSEGSRPEPPVATCT